MSEYIITGKQLERLEIPDFFTEQEIVRCRDCKHMHTVRSWLGMDVDECWFHADPERTEPDGFCAWAERRDAE